MVHLASQTPPWRPLLSPKGTQAKGVSSRRSSAPRKVQHFPLRQRGASPGRPRASLQDPLVCLAGFWASPAQDKPARTAVCCPGWVALPQRMNAILVWCAKQGWAQRAGSGPAPSLGPRKRDSLSWEIWLSKASPARIEGLRPEGTEI